MSTRILKGAKVVSLNSRPTAATVVVHEGRIVEVSEGETDRTGELIDLSGTSLFPGFIDVHNHGAVGIDVMDASSEGLQAISQFLATQGVTGWLPTTVPADDANYQRVASAVDGVKENHAARILGIHYEGPFVNTAQCGALHKEHFKTYQSPADVDRLRLPAAKELARMITLAPEIDGGIELIAELKSRGWVVSIGHTRADVTTLDRALGAGARHMTHFMNAMAPLHHRSPGPIAWGLATDLVTCDFIADGIHLDPFVLKLLVKLKGTERLTLISDAIAAAGKGDGDFKIWDETISVRNGRTSNASGNIAGSVITMLDAVRLMRTIGVSDLEIAQMASSNPARLLGIDRECGSIEVGKRADFVALDEHSRVVMTIIAGEVV